MDTNEDDKKWDTFITQLNALRSDISRSSAVNINTSTLRDATKEFCRYYFRQMRPSLISLNIDREYISRVDRHMQWLI